MNVLSGCSGIGGIDFGFKAAGWRTVCYIEREPYPQSVLLDRMREGLLDIAPIWNDFQTFDGTPWRGVVDCFTAGIPCQPHSHAGKRRGASDDRNLWPDMARIIGEVEPRVVVVENVPGLFNGPQAYGLTVVGELQQLGYVVLKRSLSARAVGAPHLRERVFIIGIRSSDDDGDLFRFVAGAGGAETGEVRWGASGDVPSELACPEPSDTSSERCGGGSYGNSTVGERADGPSVGNDGNKIRSRTKRLGQDTRSYDNASDSKCDGAQGYAEESVQRLPTFEAFENVRSPEELFGRPDIPEPLIRRGNDGIPNRVDRIKGIGNAVVPQVARQIAEEIKRIVGGE